MAESVVEGDGEENDTGMDVLTKVRRAHIASPANHRSSGINCSQCYEK